MGLLLFLAHNTVIVESVLPGYLPTLHVNVGLRSRPGGRDPVSLMKTINVSYSKPVSLAAL